MKPWLRSFLALSLGTSLLLTVSSVLAAPLHAPVKVVDVSNDETALNTTRGSLSLETVREYVVMASQFNAEYGNASGAIVSVVTR